MRAGVVLGRIVDPLARGVLHAPGVPAVDFARPIGEPALVAAESVSWRVFRNPVALFTGGVAAVLMELAEPAVRAGVWEHSGFRRDPVRRLRRTGMAAMATVYAARSVAEEMIAGVVRAHGRVEGVTPEGEPYRANDPDLLRWVQATAVWGFGTAYDCYVAPLGEEGLSTLFAEGAAAARLYGVEEPPLSTATWRRTLEGMRGRLTPSPVVGEFLALIRDAPAFPLRMRPAQRLMVRGAVSLLPGWVGERLELGDDGLRVGEGVLLRSLGRAAERIDLPSHPAMIARARVAG
jgi:uncharacterized protein (DUF2236 family)